MSAIWGIIEKKLQSVHSAQTSLMRKHYEEHCRIDRIEEFQNDSCYMACGIQHFTPEASSEHLPVSPGDGRYVLTADVVLDNRDELIAELVTEQILTTEGSNNRPDRKRPAVITDGFLLQLAFERWNYDFVKHLKGLFAIAIYDTEKRELFLCTDQISNRCLSYYCTDSQLVFSTMLTADQKIGYSSLILGIGQLLSLVAVFILTRTTKGTLTNLATYYAGVPCLVMLGASLIGYSLPQYRDMRPGLKYVDTRLVKNILNLGLQFFVIYMCLLVIFQVMNVIITRELGPEAATEYNIAYKYFGILHMVMMIVISPFWSAFTDAYTKKDYPWMNSIIRKLEYCWLACLGSGLLMLIISSLFYDIWIGDSVKVKFSLSCAVLLYSLAQILGAIYMQMINGIGTVRIQMIAYVVFALISIPLMVLSCRTFGIVGIVVVPSVVYLVQALLGKIQLHKLMNNTATGIWIK